MAADKPLLDKSRLRSFAETVLALVLGVCIALLVRTYLGEPFYVPSGSMLETIQVGDRLWGEKVTYYSSSPKRGDIVTFADPDGSGDTLIKRVIATGGQTVDLRDGVVYVNDQALSEESYTGGKPSVAFDMHSANLDANIEYPYTIPEGYVWVMGDNRTNSLDSRYFGPVSEESITSKAAFVFWPLEDAGAL